MQRPLKIIAMATVSGLILACNVSAQTPEVGLPATAQNSDEPSGWKRIEIAIFLDTSVEALSSETWEITPTTGYPDARRWLVDYAEVKSLMDQWGESAVAVNNDGFIEIIPEPVSYPEAEGVPSNALPEEPTLMRVGTENPSDALTNGTIISGEMPIENDALETSRLSEEPASQLGDLGSTGEERDSAQLALNDREVGALDEPNPQDPMASQVPLESLTMDNTNLTSNISDAESNQLSEGPSEFTDSESGRVSELSVANADTNETDSPFMIEDLGSGPDALSNNESASRGGLGGDIDWLQDFALDEVPQNISDFSDSSDFSDEVSTPALPAAYQTLDFEMLTQGLEKLDRAYGKRPIVSMAWLQAPGEIGDAVIVDHWENNKETPLVQGSIRVYEDKQPRLEVDIWANTDANYLPEKLAPLTITPPPARILVVEPAPSPLTPDAPIDEIEFIDLQTGLNTFYPDTPETPSEDLAPSSSLLKIKHAIRLNEQRELRQGYVRYIDHPVIQVAAVWRELSFAEVYALGEAQRLRRDIDSLTRTLTTPASAAEERP